MNAELSLGTTTKHSLFTYFTYFTHFAYFACFAVCGCHI